MQSAGDRPMRKTRSDVERNRERLLTAAKTVLAQAGGTASFDAIARQAGLGIGTLYRHFPTREALYEAVYRRDIAQLVDLSERSTGVDEPVAALRRWLHALVDTVATKKGMIASFALAAETTTAISAKFAAPLIQALEVLLARAAAAGRLRAAIGGEELLLAVIGMCMLRNQPEWQRGVVRLVDALVDGLVASDGPPDPDRPA